MERDYDGDSRTYAADLRAADEILAARAAEAAPLEPALDDGGAAPGEVAG